MSYSTLLCTSLDPHSARIDVDSLPQQALMELVVDRLDSATKKYFQTINKEYKDLEDWMRIRIKDGGVWKVYLEGVKAQGSLALEYLPPTVAEVNVQCNFLEGTVNLAHLPPALTVLNVGQNNLIGSLCLLDLPSQLDYLDASINELTGSIVLTSLPDTLTALNLRKNQFSGPIDLSKLPHKLKYLYLDHNLLSGQVDMTDSQHVPMYVELSNNNFSGKAIIRVSARNEISLHNNDITSVKNLTLMKFVTE